MAMPVKKMTREELVDLLSDDDIEQINREAKII